MEICVTKEIVDFIIEEFVRYDIQNSEGSIIMNDKHYDVSRKSQSEPEYRDMMRSIFSYKPYITIITAFSKSDLPLDLRNTIIHYLYYNVMLVESKKSALHYENITTTLDKLENNINDTKPNDTMFEKIKKIKNKIKSNESVISDILNNTETIERNINDIYNPENDLDSVRYTLKTITNDIARLESKIDIIDDKFNILVDFINTITK